MATSESLYVTEIVRSTAGPREQLTPASRRAVCEALEAQPLVQEWRAIFQGRAPFPERDRYRLAALVESYGAEGLEDTPHAPHAFAPTLLDRDGRQRIADAIRFGALRREGVEEVVLAFPRAASTWALLEVTDALDRRDEATADVPYLDVGDPATEAVPLPPYMEGAMATDGEIRDDFGPVVRPLPPNAASIARRLEHFRRCDALAGERADPGVLVRDDTMSDRRFGVEIEGFLAGGQPFVTQQAIVRRALNEAGLWRWEVGMDLSIYDDVRQERTGVEVRSPILQGEEGVQQLAAVYETLDQVGWVANDTCAFHVHHEVRPPERGEFDPVQRAAATLLAQEPQFDAFVAPERRGSAHDYSKRLGARIDACTEAVQERAVDTLGTAIAETSTVGQLIDVLNPQDKTHKWNFRALLLHGTIENRMRECAFGSAQEMTDWVRFSDKVVNAAMDGIAVLTMDDTRYAEALHPTLRAQRERFAPALTNRLATAMQQLTASSRAHLLGAAPHGAELPTPPRVRDSNLGGNTRSPAPEFAASPSRSAASVVATV